MTKLEFNFALNEFKRLKQEINSLVGVSVDRNLKILVCTGKTSKVAFNLKDLNRDLINNNK